MRRRPGAITALLALACAAGSACGGKHGHDTTTVITHSSFPQGFLPVRTGTPRGDVALRVDGPLLVVDCQTDDVTAISQTDGERSTYAQNVGDNRPLCSIAGGFGDDGRLFVGDDDGKIWVIATGATVADHTSTLFADTGTGRSITGLAFAPVGYGEFGGQLFAAAGSDGVLRISGDPPRQVVRQDDSANTYVDLGFSATALFAIDPGHREIDSINANGTVTTFRDGFGNPVGLAVDSTANEIYVADAGRGVLSTVPVAGGPIKERALYMFDGSPPSGITYDGLAAIAFVTSDAIRGANIPRIDPANANFAGNLGKFPGPTAGYGDLEFDRTGAFILVANDPVTKDNFLFSAPRDLSGFFPLNTGIHEANAQPGEQLLSLAIDPKTQAIYIGTDLGNLYRRDGDGTVTQLIAAPAGAPAMLGLELPPRGTFCAPDPDPCLVATTAAGTVIVIDLSAPDLDDVIRTQPGAGGSDLARLSDLVFASDGTLFVVDCDDSDPPVGSKILQIARNGSLVRSLTVDGRVDGIEIDEGGDRLLVSAVTAGPDQLLEVPLALDAAPTPLDNHVDIDDGFFPTGIVYDRLGTAVLRRGNDFTGLDAVDVTP